MTQIKYKNQIYNIPSDCSLSTGNSCETKTSRMSDGTSTSYSITTFKKPQVSSYSLSFNITVNEYPDILRKVYEFENLVGKDVSFAYCNIPFGKLMIESISVSFGLDGTKGIVSASLSFSMKDNIVLTGKAKTAEIHAREGV